MNSICFPEAISVRHKPADSQLAAPWEPLWCLAQGYFSWEFEGGECTFSLNNPAHICPADPGE